MHCLRSRPCYPLLSPTFRYFEINISKILLPKIFYRSFTSPGIDATMTFLKKLLSSVCLFVFLTLLSADIKVDAQTVSSDKSRNATNVETSPKSNIDPAQALKKAGTPSDSVRILLNAYSISDKISRDNLRVQILNIAQRSNNNEVISDVLKELSSSTDDTEALARLIEISESISENKGKKDIHNVLILDKVSSDVANTSDTNVQNQMLGYMRQGLSINSDPYKEIQNIYRAMVYLGASSQGPLYFEYIKRLENLVNQLPEEDHAIKNLYYTTAAIFYTRKRDYRKALETDWALIQELDKIKAHYADKEAADRDLNYYYYISYRRMLRNFKGLTPEQIEKVYKKCVELAQTDERAAKEFGSGGLTNSYYFMATKQYAKAIPELKKALAAENISDFRKGELLGHLSFAMRNTGDKQGELEALREYTLMLLKDREKRRNDMYKEIELRNSVNRLIADEYQAQEKQHEQNRVMRKTSITIVYVLALVLIFLCGSYLRLRRKVKILESKNSSLRKNIEYIFDDGVPKGTTDLRHQKNRLKG